jgi:CDP-diacylglycerol--glycerol-3-phosphate 3-phosphatidyltransferase
VPIAVALLSSSAVMSSSFSTSARFGGQITASVASAVRNPALLPLVVTLRGGSSSDAESPSVVDSAPAGAAPPFSSSSSSDHPNASPVHTARHPHPSASAGVHGGGGVADAAIIAAAPSPSSSAKLGPDAPPPGPIRRLFPSFPWHSLPNYLTYARCLSIPVFLLLSYYPATANFPSRAPVLSVIFALASITDWLDGYLARRWGVASPFGAFLDPVADKLMVSTALVVLSGRYGGIVAVPSSIIMAREVGVSALREWMAQRGKRDSVKVGMQGKVKAALTMVSLTLMLLVPEGVGLESVGWTRHLGSLGTGGAGCGVVAGRAVVDSAGLPWMLGPSLMMLFASAVITVTSGSVYFRAAAPVLLGKE